jgi:hypothetical protein
MSDTLRHLHTPSISCVVPAYNEAANLPRLLAELTEMLQGLFVSWQMIVVEHGAVLLRGRRWLADAAQRRRLPPDGPSGRGRTLSAA